METIATYILIMWATEVRAITMSKVEGFQSLALCKQAANEYIEQSKRGSSYVEKAFCITGPRKELR